MRTTIVADASLVDRPIGANRRSSATRHARFRIAHAYGHLPLLDDAALQVEPGERVAILGRNGTGKSTLLQILSGELRPTAARCGVSRAPASARLVQDVPLSARPRRCSMSSPKGWAIWRARRRLPPRRRATSRTTCSPRRCAQARGAAARARRARRLAPRTARGAGLVAPEPAGRRHRRHALGRVEAPRAAGAGAGRAARPAAARRADQPPRRRRHRPGSRRSCADYAGAVVFVTHDRAFLERLATRIVELDRGRLTSWPGDYADLPRARRRSGSPTRRRSRRSSTSGWPRRKRGCGRGSRRGARATRAA